MMLDDPRRWGWIEACAMLERAERMRRQFFEPSLAEGASACWEPPVDIIETEEEVWIIAALPGVQPQALALRIEGDTVVIAGRRPLPLAAGGGMVHRLEIPHGRFERRIRLVTSGLELERRELVDGCLTLSLRKKS